MVKQNLLEMVQRILESLDLQVVNSISDTREAQQIARIIKETYYHLLQVREIKSKSNLLQLVSLSDTTHPTYLKFNDDVTNIDQFKYYRKDEERYVDVEWMAPQEFLDRSLSLNPKLDNVETITDFSGIKLNVRNDKHPQYYTSFDDEYIVLDSWNKEVEHTINEQNTVVYGIKLPKFELVDTFVPDIAPQHFGYLLSKSKVNAGTEILKEYDSVEADRAMKELISTNKHARRQLGQEPTLWMRRPRSGRVTR